MIYTIPNVKLGETVDVKASYNDGMRSYTHSKSIDFSNENVISDMDLKPVFLASDFILIPPENLDYDDKEKEASFERSYTCPQKVGNVTSIQ